MQKMKRLALSTALLFALTLVAAPYAAAASAQQSKQAPQGSTTSGLTIPITGSGSGGTFAGTFELKKFVEKDGAVWASGILSGTVSTATGVIGSIVKNVLLPVTVGQTSCDILHLELGPISLDLLGLEIELNRVVLDIDAQAGPGNLLGNLLCAVVNLLNDPSALTRLLNEILDLL